MNRVMRDDRADCEVMPTGATPESTQHKISDELIIEKGPPSRRVTVNARRALERLGIVCLANVSRNFEVSRPSGFNDQP